MPKSPQDIYARHLLSPRGYPLWTPEPSHELLAYRRDGLRIGDVGIIIPEDGSFDVFFNLCLPHDHPFHQATGVPDNFKPIRLTDMDLRTIRNAENPGRIISTSAVKTIVERSGDTSSRMRSSGLEYEFNLSSSEGALLILPEGAECQDLRNYHIFLEAATRHGADWYRFAEEKVGQIIGHDSLYLITGFHKTLSWSLAAFEKTEGSGEHPALCRLPQLGAGNTTTTCTWNTTRALDWRVGPVDNFGIPNQAVFIRGFKIARRSGIFGGKWISVSADVPSARPSRVNYFGAVPEDSWLGYVFSGQSGGRGVGSRSDMQDEMAPDPGLRATINEIQNGRALAVSKDIVIHRMPEASPAFHPSDIINRYLLNKEPSANIVITHDNDWIGLLEKNMIRSEDLVQESLLEGLVSQNYRVVLEAGAAHLRSSLEQRLRDIKCYGGTTMEARKCDSNSAASAIVDQVPSTELGDVTSSHVPQRIVRVNPYSISSSYPQNDSPNDLVANEVLSSNVTEKRGQGNAGDVGLTPSQTSLNEAIYTHIHQRLKGKDKSTLRESSGFRLEQERDIPQNSLATVGCMVPAAGAKKHSPSCRLNSKRVIHWINTTTGPFEVIEADAPESLDATEQADQYMPQARNVNHVAWLYAEDDGSNDGSNDGRSYSVNCCGSSSDGSGDGSGNGSSDWSDTSSSVASEEWHATTLERNDYALFGSAPATGKLGSNRRTSNVWDSEEVY